MQPQEDVIVDISKAREKFFGCSGKMLLPSPATVEALIKKIPANQLITADLLRKKLADQFGVQATCPVTTKKALQVIANGSGKAVAYWRVIKKNGELFAIFPGGTEAQAALLRKEGFTIDTKGKAPKVDNFSESLIRFD
jgi:hypothetical protein